MTVVLGGGDVRESATSLTSGSQKPIGSHLLHQPPCWFGALRRTSPPSLRLLFHAKCRRKKSGEPMPGVRRATVCWRGRGAAAQLLGPRSGYWCCAGPRGRRAAAVVSPGTLRGSSERSRPLHGLAALILRASAAFHALGRAAAALGFAPRRRYPANSRWARSPPNAENAPQTAALGLWSARTHEAG